MFKITTDKATVQETSGGSFINKSGVYDITINFAAKNTREGKKAESIAFNINYNGSSSVLYGPYYQNNDGGVNEIGVRLYKKLGIIAGMGDGDSPTVVEETHKVGKDNKEQSFEVIEEFSGLNVKAHVHFEYSLYNGDISESKNIRAFFRGEDGATAEEIVNGDPEKFGNQLAIVLEKYADNVTYKDGLTEEDIKAWKAAKANGGKAKTAPAAKTTTATPSGPLFK